MIRKIVAGASLQSLGLGLGLLDRIVLSALLLRVWGVAIFEDWSVLLAAAGLLNLLELGLTMTFGNGYTASYQRNQLAQFQRHVSVAVFISFVIFAVGSMGLISVISFGVWNHLVHVSRLKGAEGGVVLLFLGIATLLQTAAAATFTIYRAQGYFTRGLFVDLCLSSVRLIAVAISAVAGAAPQVAAVLYLVVTIIFMLVVVPFDLRISLRNVKLVPALPIRSELVTIMKTAPWFWAQNALTISLLSVPVLVLPHVTDAVGAIATFLLLRALMNCIRQFSTALSNSVGIELSLLHLNKSDDLSVVQHHILRLTRFVTVGSSAGIGGMFWLLAPFTTLWSGGAVHVDFALALTFSVGFLLSAPFAIVANFLNFIGEAQTGAMSRMVTATISLVVGLTLAKPLGVLGVALGLAAGEVIGMGMLYIRPAAKWMGVTAPHLIRLLIFYCAAGLLPTIGIGLLLPAFMESEAARSLLLRAAVLAPVACGAIVFFGLSKTNRFTFWQAARLFASFI